MSWDPRTLTGEVPNIGPSDEAIRGFVTDWPAISRTKVGRSWEVALRRKQPKPSGPTTRIDADAKFAAFAKTLVTPSPVRRAEQRVLKAAVRWFTLHGSEDDYCDSCAALHRVMVRYLKSATIAPRAKRGAKG